MSTVPDAFKFLGYGRALSFKAPEGYELMEQGRRVYAVPIDYWCHSCDGCGCKCCKWTGEESVRRRLKAARQRARNARRRARKRAKLDNSQAS